MRQSSRTHGTHVARARKHYELGKTLHEAGGHEWAAVCYFYCAYHLIKAALLADPIFDDPQKCTAKHPDLTMGDRHTDRHQVRGGSYARGWGINDRVLILYRGIVADYDRLHQASVSVRYRDGLPEGALDVLSTQVGHEVGW